jgi:hypothetical protein
MLLEYAELLMEPYAQESAQHKRRYTPHHLLD